MFEALLKEVVDATEGGLATLVMGFDGIPLESYSKPEAPIDINTIGAELSVVLKSVKQATTMLEAGDADEIAIQSEKVTTLIRVVNSEYFVAFSLSPTGNLGKARYLLRTKISAFRKELS